MIKSGDSANGRRLNLLKADDSPAAALKGFDKLNVSPLFKDFILHKQRRDGFGRKLETQEEAILNMFDDESRAEYAGYAVGRLISRSRSQNVRE